MSNAGYFSDEHLEQIKSTRRDVDEKYRNLVVNYSTHPFANARAREYATHGFSRRLKTVCRCIDNVFTILPPDRDGLPSLDDLADATINIQAFVLNVFGALDNLAWVWVCEKGVTAKDGSPLPRREVGLGPGKTLVRGTLPPEFHESIKTFDEWFDSMVDFRDSLAHRIPLYIPPFAVSKDKLPAYKELDERRTQAIKRLDFDEYDRLLMEQTQLGTFRPWIQHSFEESANPIIFHAQLLSDFLGLAETAETLLKALKETEEISGLVLGS